MSQIILRAVQGLAWWLYPGLVRQIRSNIFFLMHPYYSRAMACLLCVSLIPGCKRDEYSEFKKICENGLNVIAFEKSKWDGELSKSSKKYFDSVAQRPRKATIFYFGQNDDF